MGQLSWRIRTQLNWFAALPGRARALFEEGWDREISRQAGERPPLAEGLAIIGEGERLLQTGEAIALFGRMLPELSASVDRDRLLFQFQDLTIEWVDFDVPEHRALLQMGHRWRIRVEWLGSAWESRLIHTLLHFVNLTVRLPGVREDDKHMFIEHDNLHRETDYWGLELTICTYLRTVNEA